MRPLPVVLVLAAACSSGPPPPAELPPQAPAANDPAFTVYGVFDWYLIGNALTPGQDQMTVQVIPPDGVDYVDIWIGGGAGQRLGPDWVGSFDLGGLGPGEYDVLLAADGSDTAFARYSIRRTAPLYVLMTNDWDDADNTDAALQLQEDLRTAFPELVMTHFVGPYTFTDPDITDERRQVLVDWVTGQRDTYGDEIGLHIHPWCNFVDTTEVACRTEPSTVYAAGDATGYTVECSAYPRQEWAALLAAADDLFVAHGLGKPTSFRAGGWTAEVHTLQALVDDGFVTDTSANNWARMEEWIGTGNGELYGWNMSHWSAIDDTSQPYWPSVADIQAPGDPAIGILELPDNGILVDYVTGEEMSAIFDANWDGTPLAAPVAFSIGYHPTDFNLAYQQRLKVALQHVEQFRAAYHDGPVVYARQSDMVQVWPGP
jgi:hypothetical protein